MSVFDVMQWSIGPPDREACEAGVKALAEHARTVHPAAQLSRLPGSMATARAFHTATLLPDGEVLVAGGGEPGPASAELYDPGTGTWTATASMSTGRAYHTATLLPDGRVLVAGGMGAGRGSAELYDPGSVQ